MAACYCGFPRSAAEAQARRKERQTDSGLRSLVVPVGLGVIVVLLYVAWPRPVLAPAPTAPGASAARAEPERETRPRRTVDATPQATLPPADASWDPPTPVPPPAASPSPSPTPTADAGPSDVDRLRAEGEKRLDESLASLRAQMDALSSSAREFEAICLGGHGDPGSCQRLFRSVAAGGEGLRRGLEDAQDDARRAWVTPGVVRDLRRKHGLDESACAAAAENAHRLIARYQGGS